MLIDAQHNNTRTHLYRFSTTKRPNTGLRGSNSGSGGGGVGVLLLERNIFCGNALSVWNITYQLTDAAVTDGADTITRVNKG